MNDDDLRVLLRSPALALQPPPELASAVRGAARRRRVRARSGAVLAGAALVAAGVVSGPSLVDALPGHGSGAVQPGGVRPDPRAPAATSAVLTLRTMNGAEVLTWFEGADWCTKTTRVTRQKTCLGPTDPQHQGFSWVLPAASPSLTVDRSHLVAGIVPPGAAQVVVKLSDGPAVSATFVSDRGFRRPVWAALLPPDHAAVIYYAAYDAAGNEIARKPA